MDEDALVRRLDEIERKTGPSGTMDAEACRAELAAWRQREADTEFRLSLPTPISQRVFLTVCQRYGLRAYRAPKQRKTSIAVSAPKGFVYEVLKPRLDALIPEVEATALAAIDRVMERWATSGAGPNESRSKTADNGLVEV
jgi:hypothetical protein